MALVLTFIGVNIFSLVKYLLRGNHFFELGPIFLTGTWAILINSAITLMLLVCFFGIIKRLHWARKVAVVWYTISALAILTELVSFLVNKKSFEAYDAYGQALTSPADLFIGYYTLLFATISVLLSWVIAELFVAIYLANRKDYFRN